MCHDIEDHPSDSDSHPRNSIYLLQEVQITPRSVPGRGGTTFEFIQTASQSLVPDNKAQRLSCRDPNPI